MEDHEFYLFKEGQEAARATIVERDKWWVSLETVVVAGQFRGRGLGKEICKKALSWCKEKGVNVLVTASPIFPDSLDEHQLKNFYESLGFTLLHPAPGRYYMELINNEAHARPMSYGGEVYV